MARRSTKCCWCARSSAGSGATAATTCACSWATAPGAVTCMVWEELERDRAARARRRCRARAAAATPSIPATARRSTCAGWQSPRPAATRSEDLLDGPARDGGTDGDASCASCWRRSASRTCAHCWQRVFGEGAELWAAYRVAPAAKHYHQAYRHGLLEHCLGVAQAVSATSATFPGIDRDVAVTGALLHDIGKLEAYTEDPGGDRPHRRRAAAGRDRARLLPRAAHDRGDRRLPRRAGAGGGATSSSPTTARWSTAARWCRARARRRSCT